MTLVEALVAVTVLAVAGTVALALYDASRKSFKKGENATEQQQAVRIAFDRLSTDLRMAGFNYNPDGNRELLDEQIEAAYDTAIVLRSDLDAEDPTEAGTPEGSLRGGALMAVSTGNDEIVVYVLAKQDGSSTDTLVFEADVKDVPRDGMVETVQIPNVALVQDDPPYNLYRITLNNDAGTWGGGGFIVRTPLVENVRSMKFKYYGAQGNQLNATFDLTSPLDDIGGTDTPGVKRLRAGIRRIETELEGLTRDPDLGWADPGDTDPATQSYRKFHLKGDITPRNMGRKGLEDMGWDVIPPSMPPFPPTLVPGHCRGLYMSWPPNPPSDRLAGYLIEWGTISGQPENRRRVGVASTSYYLAGLEDQTEYFVTIRAVDAAGNQSSPSAESSATTENLNAPKAPVGVVATQGDLANEVLVSWNAVTENTSSDPAADPRSPPSAIRDLAGYRLYYGTTQNFTVVENNLVLDERACGPQVNPSCTDRTVVNCRHFWYRAVAVDACGSRGTSDPAEEGWSTTTVAPAAATNVQAFWSGGSTAHIVWDPVTRDVQNNNIFILDYDVFRKDVPRGQFPLNQTWIATVSDATEYYDPWVPSGRDVYYWVRPLDDCPSNDAFLSSPAAKLLCFFTGTVRITSPANGAQVSAPVVIQVQVINGTDVYPALELKFRRETDGYVETVDVLSSGPPWSHSWQPAVAAPYTVTATVKNDQFCPQSTSIRLVVGP